MAKIFTNGAGTSLSGWLSYNATIQNNCYNIKKGYIKQVVGITPEKQFRQYKLSYNCVQLRDRVSYFLITTTNPFMQKDTYFIPILFNDEQSVVFDINDDINSLTFQVFGDLVIKDIVLETYEGISENTRETLEEIVGEWEQITDGLGHILTERLVGAIDAAVNNIINSSNNVIIDSNGITIRNASTDALSTWAMRLSSAGFMIADGKKTDGTWNWKTAGTGKGLVADAVTTGKLSAIDLESVNILSSVLSSANIKGGRIEIGDNASTTFTVIDGNGKTFGVYMKNSNNQLKSILDLWGDNVDGGTIVIRSNEQDGSGNFLKVFEVTANTAEGPQCADILTFGDVSWYGGSGNDLFMQFGTIYVYGGSLRTSKDVIAGRDVYADGDMGCGGTKTAIVQTEHYGKRKLYCEESDRLYFSTKGIVETVESVDGQGNIEYKYILKLDDAFFETIEPNDKCPYLITATPYGNARVWVDKIYNKYIIFKSDSICKFSYNLQAIRKEYADTYLEEVEK